MRVSYAVAAGFSLLAAVLRTWDGETEVLQLARLSIADQKVLGFFHLTWYMVTVVFLLSGILLGYLAVRSDRPGTAVVGRFVGAIFLFWSAAIAGVSSVFVWHPGTAIPMVVTLVIGVLAIAGSLAGKGEPAS